MPLLKNTLCKRTIKYIKKQMLKTSPLLDRLTTFYYYLALGELLAGGNIA